jgi:two-component system chemotaxis sensor kinase CheA
MTTAPPLTKIDSRADGMDEAVREFLIESNEGLDRFDDELVQLEKQGRSPELLDSVFRVVHTIKGSGGTLGFRHLLRVSHVGENLLSRLRDGSLLLSPAVTSALLAMADCLRRLLREIEACGCESDGDYSGVVERLTELLTAAPTGTAPPDKVEPQADRAPQPEPSVGEILVGGNVCRPEDLRAALELQQTGDPRRVGEILLARGAVSPTALADALKTQAEHHDLASATIRVEVARLDAMMNLVGELVLARNQILRFAESQPDPAFAASTQHLDAITAELQEAVMKTRMQPIGRLWEKLPRMLRDLAMSCGKQVELDCEGADTDLDKTLLEAIKDPLTHLVRNAIDHGIESPELRRAQGKSPSGHLRLRAFHEGGLVHIEIADDGAGIRVERLRDKAIALGLLDAERAAALSPAELLHLAFVPGLSTAERVSDVSGRGVGMDVVKTNMEKIGGTVQLESALGQGTLVKITIPLTLTIIPALLVSSQNQRFAIPQANVVELVQRAAESRAIEEVRGAAIYRLRGHLLPLVYLDRLLQLPPHPPLPAINIVVLRAGQQQFGLVVEEISDSQEIVVKPLACGLEAIAGFAGATILGDGRVALILDVAGMVRRAGLFASAPAVAIAGPQEKAAARHPLAAWLVFRLPADRRGALPLSAVARLEEIPAARVERAGERELVQYRGQLMPLLRLSTPPAADHQLLQVIVHAAGNRCIGLVVDEILDIVEQPVLGDASLPGAAQPVTVLQQRVTELLDLPALVRQSFSAAPGAAS